MDAKSCMEDIHKIASSEVLFDLAHSWQRESSGRILRVDDDDDDLIVFPPGADDNSYALIYSEHIHLKTRPECGTSLNMTPAPCYIKFTNVLTPAPITHGDMPAPIRG